MHAFHHYITNKPLVVIAVECHLKAHLFQNLPKKQLQNEAITRYAKNKMRKQTNAMSSQPSHPVQSPTKSKQGPSPNHKSKAAKIDGDNHRTSRIRYPKCRQKCKINILLKKERKSNKDFYSHRAELCCQLFDVEEEEDF